MPQSLVSSSYPFHNMIIAPSFLAHMAQGLLILYLVWLIFTNFSSLQHLNIYHKIVVIILIAILIGVHGISHLGLESVYQFMPTDI